MSLPDAPGWQRSLAWPPPSRETWFYSAGGVGRDGVPFFGTWVRPMIIAEIVRANEKRANAFYARRDGVK